MYTVMVSYHRLSFYYNLESSSSFDFYPPRSSIPLVDLDGSVDLVYKCPAGEETNRASQDKEQERN